MKGKRILFLVPYPLNCAPSQRFRVELFLPAIEKAGFKYSVKNFMDISTWNVFYSKGNTVKKIIGLMKGFLRRTYHVFFIVPFYDFIFIHREASPAGPPVFEWLIAKIFRKKIIYDFDDAIWIADTNSGKITRWIKAFWKIKYICKWAYKCSCGNNYLCDFASQFNDHVIYMPTCVDTEKGHYKIKEHSNSSKLVIGWTGSHSTLKYLDEMLPVFNKLKNQVDFDFLVIANKAPDVKFENFKFIKWNQDTENEDLLKMDIGIMPLHHDKWSEGKCGFKLIQYLACGIPALASPVGVNKVIIEENKNGFLCNSEEDWVQKLFTLLENSELRNKMGAAGRNKIVNEYSIQSREKEFIQLFS